MNDLLSLEFSDFISGYSNFFKVHQLTNREMEVAFLVNKGKKNRDIGDLLFISETTVKKHVYNIFNKTNINNRFELICTLRSSVQINSIDRAC